jgi:hypothetical protein
MMFASAWLMGVFGWGTWTAGLFLLLSFAIHVTSLADVLRQRAFPEFAGGEPTFSASLVRGAAAYVPALVAAWHLAWPGVRAGREGEQYLVDRGGYVARDPRAGEWVFFAREGGRGFDLGRVFAVPGDEVDWEDGEARVNGERVGKGRGGWGREVRTLRLKVPPGRWLVAVGDPGRGRQVDAGSEFVLVARLSLRGRPWAQSLPLRSRRLLL